MRYIFYIILFFINSIYIYSQNSKNVEYRLDEVIQHLKFKSEIIYNFFGYKEKRTIRLLKSPESFVFVNNDIVKQLYSSDSLIDFISLESKIGFIEDSLLNALKGKTNYDHFKDVATLYDCDVGDNDSWISFIQTSSAIRILHSNTSNNVCFPFLTKRELVLLNREVKPKKFKVRRLSFFVMVSENIENFSCALIVPVSAENSYYGIVGYLFLPPSPLLFVFKHDENGEIIESRYYEKKLSYPGDGRCPFYSPN